MSVGPFTRTSVRLFVCAFQLLDNIYIFIYMDKERVLTEGGHTLKCKRRNFSVLFDVLSSCRYVTYFHSIVVIFESFSMIDNIVTSKWGKISLM